MPINPNQNYSSLGRQPGDDINRTTRPTQPINPNSRTESAGGGIGSAAPPPMVSNKANPGYQQLGTPQTYDSTGSYGSGFVNLSHMLNLNKASGEASAQDMAKQVQQQGQAAQSGIGAAWNRFYDEANKSGVRQADYGPASYNGPGKDNEANYHNVPGDKVLIDKAAKGYKGPGSMAENAGYDALNKQVGSAEDMAKDVRTGNGLAAQIGKSKGISPTQSAAGAFYMGVNNPNLKSAGDPFQNLRQTLAQNNATSVDYAQMARKQNTIAQGELKDKLAGDNQYWQDVADAEGPSKTIHDDAVNRGRYEVSDKQRVDAIAAKQRSHNADDSEIQATDDVTNEVENGVPYELALHGVTYEDWKAAGMPQESYDDWVKNKGVK